MQVVWLGERTEEKFVDEAFELVASILGVDGVAAVFDGPDSYNALASPEQLVIASRRRAEGSVLIGRALLERERVRRGSKWKSSVAMVVAHEASHLLQYDRQLNLPVMQMELHADFLAGWALERLRRKGKKDLTSFEAAEAALREMSTSRFGTAAFHGSAEQRIDALRTGRAESSSSEPPLEEGLEHLGIR